jgi:hypothetical protein
MQATNGILWYFFFLALLRGHSSSEMKESVHRLQKTGLFFYYGNGLLVIANNFSAKYISISVSVNA